MSESSAAPKPKKSVALSGTAAGNTACAAGVRSSSSRPSTSSQSAWRCSRQPCATSSPRRRSSGPATCRSSGQRRPLLRSLRRAGNARQPSPSHHDDAAIVRVGAGDSKRTSSGPAACPACHAPAIASTP